MRARLYTTTCIRAVSSLGELKLDDRAATEELVNGLAAALAEDDKEEVNRLMYDAQEKIENLPDGFCG